MNTEPESPQKTPNLVLWEVRDRANENTPAVTQETCLAGTEQQYRHFTINEV